MGKTRLVTAATALESSAVFVASGSCLPLSTEVPFLPVADALRAVYAVDGGRWVTDALAECSPFVSGSLQRLLPELGEADLEPESADGWSRQRLFTSVEATFAALAAMRPLALLVEDLHWADSATLDLLEHLVVRGTTAPVLGTWRLEDPATAPAPLDWFTRMRRLPNVEVLELPPLTRDETGEQLALLLSGPLAPTWSTGCTGGPEVTRCSPTSWPGTPAGGGDMPRLLVDLLDKNLQGLTGQAWAVARSLGVADRPLLESQLGEVADLTADELVQAERELADRRLLTEPSDRSAVSLRHPLLAEAVRRHLVAGEAADQHRRLRAGPCRGADPAPAEIAAHWQAAGEHDARAGLADPRRAGSRGPRRHGERGGAVAPSSGAVAPRCGVGWFATGAPVDRVGGSVRRPG